MPSAVELLLNDARAKIDVSQRAAKKGNTKLAKEKRDAAKVANDKAMRLNTRLKKQQTTDASNGKAKRPSPAK